MMSAGTQAFGQGGTDLTFTNGLRVVVQEDHRTPEVVVQVWYKVGSMDEVTGLTGLAHVLEHMMFRGTVEVPPGDFASRIAAAGGRVNAFTSYNYTAYSEQMPKEGLELALRLEADRMRNLQITEAEFGQEMRNVVAERQWRIEDRPQARLREQLMAAVFAGGPGGHPVIGWKQDLERLKAVDAREWYARWYAPNAAIVVIVGDVDCVVVLDQVRRYFASLPAKVLPPRGMQRGLPQRTADRILMPLAEQASPYFAMAYPVPGLQAAHDEGVAFALRVLAGVLESASAAHARGIGTAQTTAPIRVWYDMLRPGQSVFMIDGTAPSAMAASDPETAIREYISNAKQGALSDEELEPIKVRLAKSEGDRMRTAFGRANVIGLMTTGGLASSDYNFIANGIRQVRAEDVRDAARSYLLDTRLTTAQMRREIDIDRADKRQMMR